MKKLFAYVKELLLHGYFAFFSVASERAIFFYVCYHSKALDLKKICADVCVLKVNTEKNWRARMIQRKTQNSYRMQEKLFYVSKTAFSCIFTNFLTSIWVLQRFALMSSFKWYQTCGHAMLFQLKDSVHFDSKKWNLLLNFFSTQNNEFSSDSIDFFFW